MAATLPATSWPLVALPSGPRRSGILRAPAAKMTGVERRNENRKAFSRLSPWNMPPTMATPSRLIPASRASACAAPTMPPVGSPICDRSFSAAASTGTMRSSRSRWAGDGPLRSTSQAQDGRSYLQLPSARRDLRCHWALEADSGGGGGETTRREGGFRN